MMISCGIFIVWSWDGMMGDARAAKCVGRRCGEFWVRFGDVGRVFISIVITPFVQVGISGDV